MAILNKNVRYKQLLCLYSKKTLRQLSFLRVTDPDLESFMAKADQEQYGVATVNVKVVNGEWSVTGCKPENLEFSSQFLTREQQTLLSLNK